MFEIVSRHGSELLTGLKVTLALCLICWTVSLLCGGTLGVLGARWRLRIGLPSQVISILLSGVPPIVFLFWLHYPAQQLLGIIVDPFITSSVALSILGTFMVADTVRTALQDFPDQYVVAGRVCGLSEADTLWIIKIPIVMRSLVPNLLSIAILLLQMTLFASFISVAEIFRVAERINATEYQPIEIFTALTLFLLAVCVPVQLLGMRLRARYSRDLAER